MLYSYMRVSVVMKDGCTSYDPALGNIHFGEKLNEEGAYYGQGAGGLRRFLTAAA